MRLEIEKDQLSHQMTELRQKFFALEHEMINDEEGRTSLEKRIGNQKKLKRPMRW
jgi:hypothetical protein